jgi:hypothetical protein
MGNQMAGAKGVLTASKILNLVPVNVAPAYKQSTSLRIYQKLQFYTVSLAHWKGFGPHTQPTM